ncbi:MAG TPA: hypothetical protein VGH38_34355 [Bryobacteraceae bacterium]
MDPEFSDELTALMPVVPHHLAGENCSGCIVAAVEDGHVELLCNTCGAVVGVVRVGIMEAILGLDSEHATCPYCNHPNTLAELDDATSHVCEHCGRSFGL